MKICECFALIFRYSDTQDHKRGTKRLREPRSDSDQSDERPAKRTRLARAATEQWAEDEDIKDLRLRPQRHRRAPSRLVGQRDCAVDGKYPEVRAHLSFEDDHADNESDSSYDSGSDESEAGHESEEGDDDDDDDEDDEDDEDSASSESEEAFESDRDNEQDEEGEQEPTDSESTMSDEGQLL